MFRSSWCLLICLSILGVVLTNPVDIPSQALISSEAGDGGSKVMLIAVETAPSHFKARRAIRDTWMMDSVASKIGARVRFFIGHIEDSKVESQVLAEATQYNDIVRIGVVEKYENLGEKTLEIISWASDNKFGTVVKVDDDTLLDVHALTEFLKAHPSDWLYAGVIKDDGYVIDDPSSKWFMRDQFPFDTFPQYAFGPCYVLGAAAVKYIADRRHSLPVYRVEDAGVSLWLQGQPLVVEKMPAHLYLASCADAPTQPVFVSPVNEHEMPTLFRNIRAGDVCGDRARAPYVLEECQQHRCRCWPPPDSGCESENFSAEQYQDVIPRL